MLPVSQLYPVRQSIEVPPDQVLSPFANANIGLVSKETTSTFAIDLLMALVLIDATRFLASLPRPQASSLAATQAPRALFQTVL